MYNKAERYKNIINLEKQLCIGKTTVSIRKQSNKALISNENHLPDVQLLAARETF